MPVSHQIIFCTCPDDKVAKKLATHLVSKKLAACVNIVPGLTSVYEWQGEIETAQEHLLLIKSRDDVYPQIEAAILEQHPYELPEIVAVPMAHALPQYLEWMDSCLLQN